MRAIASVVIEAIAESGVVSEVVSGVVIVVVIGVSVDYSVHLVHSFNESPGNSAGEKVRDAMASW